MSRTKNAAIYDFETMGQDGIKNVVVNMALLNFDQDCFIQNPYEYDELMEKVAYIKFDVEDQVKNYGRKIDKDTMKWWSEQSKEAQSMLRPTKDDKSISEIPDFWYTNVMCHNLQYVYTRNNTFDPKFLEYLCKDIGKKLPYEFWKIRDTKSVILGLTWGSNSRDDIIPPGLEKKFVKHDPRHDIVMDVMRLQFLVRYINDIDDDLNDGIPF